MPPDPFTNPIAALTHHLVLSREAEAALIATMRAGVEAQKQVNQAGSPACAEMLHQITTGEEARATGQPARPPAQSQTPGPAPTAPQPQAASGDITGLARKAQQLLSDYERLSAEGKHREAGEKLDQLKQTINEMNRRRSQ